MSARAEILFWNGQQMARWATVLEVLFFKSMHKSITLKSFFMCYCATSLTHLGIVAENRQIWTSFLLCLLTVPKIWKIINERNQNFTYSFYIFFKAEFEHLVSFVKDNCPNVWKVDVTPFDVIKNTTCCANKDVNTSSELSSLVIHWDTSIDSERVELRWVMLKSTKLILNL